MTTEFNTITLLDGEEFAARYPETFEMPPLVERQTLQDRDLVKLGFIGDPTGERMWVLVEGRDAAGEYYGTLNSVPVVVTCVRYGDVVSFGPEHVIEIDRYVKQEADFWLLDLCSCAPVYLVAPPEHAHRVNEMVTEIVSWLGPQLVGRNAVGTAHCAEMFFGDFGAIGADDELGYLHAEARTAEQVAHAIANAHDDNGQRPMPWVMTYGEGAWHARQIGGEQQ